MPNKWKLPELTVGDEPADFAIKLRLAVFETRDSLASHYPLDLGTISKYESGAITPPLEYLASLSRLLLARRSQANMPDAERAAQEQFLLAQIENLVSLFPDKYKRRLPFSDWAHLGRGADKYERKRSQQAVLAKGTGPPATEGQVSKYRGSAAPRVPQTVGSQIIPGWGVNINIITTTLGQDQLAGNEPPLLVFVSSPVGELGSERQALHQAVMGLNITKPWVLGYTPASTQPLENTYLDSVRACDFFILLLDENTSPNVEQEVDTALRHAKPILLFLKEDRPDKHSRRSPEARALISKVRGTWWSFVDTSDLVLKARASLTDEIIRRVRAGNMVLPSAEAQQLEQLGRTLNQALLNLPPRRYTHLVGREKQIDEILARLRSVGPLAQTVVAITGLGGIGKTALAYEVSQRLLLEGRFWESAKSLEFIGTKIVPRGSPASISFPSLLASIARQLDHEEWLALSLSDLQKRVRYALQTSSYLVVVDNLETVQDYETLALELHSILGSSQADKPSKALLTSRERLVDNSYVYDHYIEGLSEPDSRDFLRQEAENRGAQGLLHTGERLLKRVYTITRGMPLALQLVVSQYLVGIALDSELDRLQEAKEEQLYEFIYMDLWFKLSIPAQKVMVAVAAFTSSAARSMLQPVSRTTEDEFESALTELVRMSLVEPSVHPLSSERRYSIHPVTRWFINAPLRSLWERQKATEQKDSP
jgi:hypothetical protein